MSVLAAQVCHLLDATPPPDRDTAWTITRTAFTAPAPDATAAQSFAAISSVLLIGVGQAIVRGRPDLADTLLDIVGEVAADHAIRRAIRRAAAAEATGLDDELAELTT